MTGSTASRGRMVLIAVLALSLLGNALALGAALRLRHMRDALGADASVSLPAALRRDVFAALGRDQNLKAALTRVQTARQAFVAAATAQPFDRAATDATLTALRGAVTALMEQGQGVVLAALAAKSEP